jgi:hypothetical protein
VWQRVSTVDCAALYKVGLQGLMKALYLRADMIAPLIAPIGQWMAQYPGDSDQLLHIMKVCARKLTLWPRDTKPKRALTMAVDGPAGRPKGGAPRKPDSDRLCMDKREGRPCKNGLKCPFKHDGMSGKVCTNAAYLSTACCSNFGSCPDKHPYDAVKHGDKAALMAKFGPRQLAERAYFHAVNVVEPANTTALEAGNSTVPLEWVNFLIAQGFEREDVLNVLYSGVDLDTVGIILMHDAQLADEESTDSDATVLSGYSSGDPRQVRDGPTPLCGCPGVMGPGRGSKSTHGCMVELHSAEEIWMGRCFD